MGNDFFWGLKDVDGEKKAAIDETYSITYNEAINRTCQIKEFFTKRCTVLMLTDNDMGSFFGYFAFAGLYNCVLLIENKAKIEFIEEIISSYEPQYIWCNNSMREQLGLECEYEAYSYCLCRTSFESYLPAKNVGVVLTTSGSTGNVKCVCLGYDQIKKHSAALADSMGFTRDDSFITTMPLSFVHTLSFINFHIMNNATVVLSNRSILDKRFWKLFDENKPTFFTGMSLHYAMLEKMGFFRNGANPIRVFSQGSDLFKDPVRTAVREYCNLHNKKCYILYGQTETSGTCSVLDLARDRGKNCIGSATSSGSLYISDADSNGQGELVYRGLCAMLGYVKDNYDIKRISPKEDVVRTGDVAQMDEDGYICLCGRVKRIIKINGRRTSLDDIEDYVKSIIGVGDCACIDVEDKLIVFIEDYDGIDGESIKKSLANFLECGKSCIDIIVINEIIRNERGKVFYSELEKTALSMMK
jgi:acyl-coenzyme A synthetase/AMP-(fatty) acid ligase